MSHGKGNAPSKFGPIKLKIKVLEDFDNENQIPEIDDIMRKEDSVDVEIADGRVYSFGNDQMCDVYAP